MCRHDPSDFEWKVIELLLPNKPRGVPRVNDRRVLNGTLWCLCIGSPWRGIPERFGLSTTCYNSLVSWRQAGAWDRILQAVSAGYDGDLTMIDSSCVRVHQHRATGKGGSRWWHGTFPWRPDHQDPCPCGCQRAADPNCSRPGAGS
jgi:transposase